MLRLLASRMHLCLACYRGALLLCVHGLPFQCPAATADARAIEFDQATDSAKRLDVLLAVEGSEHAGVIGEGGDRGTNAVTERFADRVTPEIVVSLSARRLGDDFQRAGVSDQIQHRIAGEVLLEVELGLVPSPGVQVVKSEPEPPEVLLARRRDDVDPVGDFAAAVDHTTEGADDDEPDAVLVEGLEHRDRIERLPGWHQRSRASSIASRFSCGERCSNP